MDNVGWATLQIIPSMKGIGRGLADETRTEMIGPAEQVGAEAGDRSAKSFGGSFASGLKSVTKTAIIGFSAALGVGAVAAGAWGLKTAAANEQAAVAFEGMLGDAQRAQDFIAQMKDFAAKTPFELPGLQDAARQLLGVGFAADQVLPTLNTIGNLAAALGVGEDAIQSVIRALGQMKGKGKASAEELQQISEAVPGFSAIGAIADSMGISTADAFKQMAAGAIPADDAITAVLEGMQKFPGAADAMERQSQTLSGMLSTLKDTAGQGLADMMSPVVEGLKRSMPQLTDTISGLMVTLGPVLTGAISGVLDTVARLLPAISPVLETLGGLFSSVLGGLAPVIEKLSPFIAQFASTLGDSLGSALDQILPPLGDLLAAFGPLLPMLADIVGALVGALAPVLAEVAAALVPVVAALVEGMQPVVDSLVPLLPQLTAAFLPLIPPLGRLLVALAPLIVLFSSLTDRVLIALLPVLIPIIEKVANFAATLIDGLVPAVQQITDWIIRFTDALFAGDWSKAGEMLSTLWESFRAGAGQAWDALVAGLQAGLPILGKWFTDTALPWLGQHLLEWGKAFAAWVPGALQQLLVALGAAIAAIGVWSVTTAIPWLGQHLLEWGLAFVAWVDETAPKVLAKLGELVGNIATWVVSTGLPWLVQSLLNWSAAFIGWIIQAIFDLPVNMTNLLNTLTGWVIDAAPTIISTLLGWAAAFLGWVDDVIAALPAKLLEIAGVILGWLNELPGQIADAAKNLFLGLTNAFIAALNWIVHLWNDLRLELPEIDTHIPGIGKVGGFTLDTPNLPDQPSIPSFHGGGVVPGRHGADVLAMLQAGERVIPAGDTTNSGWHFGPGAIQIVAPSEAAAGRDLVYELRKHAPGAAA